MTEQGEIWNTLLPQRAKIGWIYHTVQAGIFSGDRNCSRYIVAVLLCGENELNRQIQALKWSFAVIFDVCAEVE